MEKAKKTTKTPETSKAKTTKKVKAVEFKPLKVNLEPEAPSCRETPQGGSCPHKKGIHCILLLVLLANLVIGIFVIIKIMELQNWIIMGSGGEANLKRLEAIYATSQYQEYFAGEISNLEAKIKTLNPTAG